MFSTFVIAVLFVPTVLVCVAVALESPGAPIYFQKRVGFGDRAIHVLKVRTIVSDADEVAKYLNADQMEQWERKADDGPRVTRAGAFLRRTSLDELPQFLDVFIGSIPLRVLKTRRGLSAKMLGAFALPARSARTRIAVSLQVRAVVCAVAMVPQNLFQYFIAGYGEMRGIFAKRDFRIEFPLLGGFLPVPRNGLSI